MSRLRDRTAALSWRPSATLAEHLPPVDDRPGDDGLSFDDVLAGRTHSPDLGRRLSFLVIRWVGCCVGGVLALLVAVRAQLAAARKASGAMGSASEALRVPSWIWSRPISTRR